MLAYTMEYGILLLVSYSCFDFQSDIMHKRKHVHWRQPTDYKYDRKYLTERACYMKIQKWKSNKFDH